MRRSESEDWRYDDYYYHYYYYYYYYYYYQLPTIDRKNDIFAFQVLIGW